MTSDQPTPPIDEPPSTGEVGPPNPQYAGVVEKTYSLPEETIARIRAEAERDQTSESEALTKMVEAYQPGV